MNQSPKAIRWLLLLNVAVAFYNVGTIWLTQVACYPLWAVVGPAEFHTYHVAWWHDVWGVALFPGAVATVGGVALLRWRPLGVTAGAVWLTLAPLLAAWILTALWWGRWQAEMEQVTGPLYGPLYHRLLTTHWLRVALITGYAILLLRLAGQSGVPGACATGAGLRVTAAEQGEHTRVMN